MNWMRFESARESENGEKKDKGKSDDFVVAAKVCDDDH